LRVFREDVLVCSCGGRSSASESAATVLLVDSVKLLVSPDGVGNPAPCPGGGNTLYFDGTPGDLVHPGIETVTGGTWSAQLFESESGVSAVQIARSPRTRPGTSGSTSIR
jgi:hypothetical protein